MTTVRLFDVENSHIGEKVVARGQFRSYNKHEETRNRLILSVFVREISVLDDEEDEAGNKPNQIYLDGYICKEPVYRMTPLGREIADILLAVNRAYGKSDYIPCICWGRNARFAGKLKVGEHVAVWGRIQSREYQKRIGNDQIISKTAYERPPEAFQESLYITYVRLPALMTVLLQPLHFHMPMSVDHGNK